MEESTWYGTAALKVRGKGFCRLRDEDGDARRPGRRPRGQGGAAALRPRGVLHHAALRRARLRARPPRPDRPRAAGRAGRGRLAPPRARFASVASGARVLRRRRRPLPPRRQDRRDPRLRLAGSCPFAEPQGLRGRRRGRPARGLRLGREGARRRARGDRHRRRRLARRHRDGAAARREARPGLPRGDRRRDRARQPAAVRPRLLDPLRRDRAAAGGRRRARGAQGPRPPRAPPVRRGARRPVPDRDPAGRDRQREAAHARLREGDRRHARGRDRDDVQGGDRDRPVRRAGRAVRRRLRARQGRLRDAGRGGLRPEDGLLRVPPRAQADRRPDVREGPERHALLDLQHRRVRRLLARHARHRRRRRARR